MLVSPFNFFQYSVQDHSLKNPEKNIFELYKLVCFAYTVQDDVH